MVKKFIILIIACVSISNSTRSLDLEGLITSWENSFKNSIEQKAIKPVLEIVNIPIDPNKATSEWEQIESNNFIKILIKRHFDNDSINGIFSEYLFFTLKNITSEKINVRWIYKLKYCFTKEPVSVQFNILLDPNETKEANIFTFNNETAILGHFINYGNINGNDLTEIKLNKLQIYKLDD